FFPPLKQIADTLQLMAKITGKDFLEKYFGIKSEEDTTPEVLFDLPAWVRKNISKDLGDVLEGDPYRQGIEQLKRKMMYNPGGKSSSVGDVPIGLAAAANSSLASTPGFRITSTTGGQHAGSAHGEGRAMDFVVDPKYYDAVIAKLR